MKKLIGMANHVYKDKTITSLEISTLTGEDLGYVVVKGYGGESVLIHSQAQLEELYALVSLAINALLSEKDNEN